MFDTDFLTVWQTGGELVFNRSTTHRQEAILEKIKNNVNDENVFWILEEEVGGGGNTSAHRWAGPYCTASWYVNVYR